MKRPFDAKNGTLSFFLNPLTKALHKFEQRKLKKIHKREAKRWFKDQGDTQLRLNYPSLNKESVVFDLGGYVGDFAADIHQKYGCKIYVFEPHPIFYRACVDRFADKENITVLNYGLSDENGYFHLSDSVDGSSFLNKDHKNKNTFKCEVRDALTTLKSLHLNHIDLMKINIEGGEYPLLEHLENNETLGIADHLQIQFHHFIEGAKERRETITKALSKTHELTWCYDFVWENWEIKKC